MLITGAQLIHFGGGCEISWVWIDHREKRSEGGGGILKFLEILIQRATDKGDDKVDMAITFNDKSLHEYREYLLSQIIKNSKN